MRLPRHLAFPALLTLSVALAGPAHGAPIVVEISAEASRSAANDLVRATLSAEASGTTPGELARQINRQISEALKTAKTFPSVKTQTGTSASYPIYAKGGKIEAWRMRSELALESSDTAALSELLGQLQLTLGVASLVVQPSAETHKKAEDLAMIDAIAAFKARAAVVADTLGKSYRIKQMSVNTGGRVIQPVFRSSAKSLAAEAAAMPVEAGESQVTASIAGQIELE